jgi:hypothetical protein
MIVTEQQVQRGVINYIENEIAVKATGVKKFGIYFLMPVLDKKVLDYLEMIKKIAPDLFTEDGHIKVGDMYNFAKSAINKSGQFEYLGIIFNETDIDKLYSHIRGV